MSPAFDTNMKIFVITGGPCSGKTEVVNELKRRGYYVVREVALYLIEKEAKNKGNIFPWTNIKKFMDRVYKLQVIWEKKIPKTKNTAILDRSLIDCVAYYDNNGIITPRELEKAIHKVNYDKIFFLEMLPKKYWNKTKGGKPRGQTYEQGQKLHKKIKEVYKKYKQDILQISFMSIRQRTDIIEKHILSKK